MIQNDLFVRLLNYRISNAHSRREDYLTEVFAIFLQSDEDFLKRCTAHWGWETEPCQANIRTQLTLGSHGRIDLDIESQNHRLLIESKVDSAVNQAQLQRYLTWSQQQSNTQLLLLAPTSKLVNFSSSTLEGPFLGSFAWEDIAQLLAQHLESHDDISGLGAALLRLFKSLGLYIDAQISEIWDSQDTDEGRELVKNIGQILDKVAIELSQNPQLLEATPPMYRTDDSLLSSGGFTYSGKGPSPRPVLSHSLNLHNRFSFFHKAMLSFSFRIYAEEYDRHPSLALMVYTGPPAQLKDWLNEIQPRFAIQADDPSLALLYTQYRKRVLSCLKETAQRLNRTLPLIQEGARPFQTSFWLGIHLMYTKDLLGEHSTLDTLKTEIQELYHQSLLAFFQSQPQIPFALLLAEAEYSKLLP